LQAKASNPNIEARSTKWFDKLTTLSRVEGQIRNPNPQMFKTKLLESISFTFGSFGFRNSDFEFPKSLVRNGSMTPFF
jgi:hypothetical protein